MPGRFIREKQVVLVDARHNCGVVLECAYLREQIEELLDLVFLIARCFVVCLAALSTRNTKRARLNHYVVENLAFKRFIIFPVLLKLVVFARNGIVFGEFANHQHLSLENVKKITLRLL